MEQMAISKFKASCLAVLERVNQTGEPVLLTRFGKPVALVGPPPVPALPRRRLGAMRGTGKILGDIIGPVVPESDWEALQP